MSSRGQAGASSAAERSGESAHDHPNVRLRFSEESLLCGKADVKDVHQAVRRVRRFASERQVVCELPRRVLCLVADRNTSDNWVAH
jgi:hypothetical protein